MDILDKSYITTMPDGSRWAVPVSVVAKHRAGVYAHEYGHDPERSLNEDTAPLLREQPDEVADWAKNNMDWEDVQSHATKLEAPVDVDYQEGWVNGESTIEASPK